MVRSEEDVSASITFDDKLVYSSEIHDSMDGGVEDVDSHWFGCECQKRDKDIDIEREKGEKKEHHTGQMEKRVEGVE